MEDEGVDRCGRPPGRYEVGFGVQGRDEGGEEFIGSFDSAINLLEYKIQEICGEVDATVPPTLYLTADSRLANRVAKYRSKRGLPPLEYIPNFRESISTSTVYKGGRSGEKPYHYDNLTEYILANFDVKVAVGFEADDLISIDHRANPDSIICTRDKDLRITPGKHFGWVCGKQPQFGPKEIDKEGYIELVKNNKEIKGGGLKFFYSQMFTGDKVDNIPGLPKYGPVAAYKILSECATEEEMYTSTVEEYKKAIGDDWEKYFLEQANLLWMIQEIEGNRAFGFSKFGEQHGSNGDRLSFRVEVWVPSTIYS